MIRRIGTTCIDVDQAPAGCSPLSDLDQSAPVQTGRILDNGFEEGLLHKKTACRRDVHGMRAIGGSQLEENFLDGAFTTASEIDRCDAITLI
jgi:hypothetical protein